MTIVEAIVDAIEAAPSGGPHLLIVTRENSLVAFGEAKFKVLLTCWGMHRLLWRLNRALRHSATICKNLNYKDAGRIASYLAPEPSSQIHLPQKITIYCPCGKNHTLFIENHPWKECFSLCLVEVRPSKLLWRLRDALWPKDYALGEVLLTAEQATRLAAFLRRWCDV